ncbi:MAG: replication restart helicase PriA, partial [Flexibacteraceae bacterium]
LYSLENSHLRYINKKQLTSAYGESSVKALIDKHVIQEIQVEISRFGFADNQVDFNRKQIELSPVQQRATTEILNAFQEKDVVLLHGVTGSGKTEVYLNLIRKAIEAGTQALFILPEIALTTQILSRIKNVLGNNVALYHSRMSDAERAELYINVLEGKVPLVVGVRSALFLPFQNLSLIVVDEEHEPSYKQNDPAPRYHGRDVAIVLAKYLEAKVLLGSATPSFEAYYQTQIGKWALVEMNERYANAQLPEVEVIDIRPFRENKELKGNFSPPLLDLLAETKKRGFQSILFQNRRGYSPYVMCNACGEIPKCINCDVSLTQHLKQHVLRCHYCGYTEPALKACKVCGSVEINSVGFGTERIEDELSLLLPNL